MASTTWGKDLNIKFVTDMPRTDQHRSPFLLASKQRDLAWQLLFDGVLANGTGKNAFAVAFEKFVETSLMAFGWLVLPDAQYKIVMAALQPMGDPTKKTDWQIVESGDFIIARNL